MNRKENKGGLLSNKQVEAELEHSDNDPTNGHRGSQDTGDDVVRAMGTPVQKEDGAGSEQDADTKSSEQ